MLLKWFIKKNKELSEAFCRRYPKIAYENDYNRILLERVSNYINERAYTYVLEVGGIDRPLLKKSRKMKYDGLDIEYNNNIATLYDNFFNQSIEQSIPLKYDLIISMTLLERVQNNRLALKVIYDSLNKGGKTIHYVPSKYHPYALILRLVGPTMQKYLLKIFFHESIGLSGYKTYFDCCSPKEMKKLLFEIGFVHCDFTLFYRVDYFKFWVPFFISVLMFENICKKLNLSQFCSGFIFVATK